MAPLTAKQTDALKTLAASNPFRWKQQLRDCWEGGRSDGSPLWTTLYSLRNTHGPSWLVRFRIKAVR